MKIDTYLASRDTSESDDTDDKWEPRINIKMPNGRIITLRAKDEVKVGRLRDAIREAGLTAEEFLELLR